MSAPRKRGPVAQGVSAGAQITVYMTAGALWVEGWYVAMAAAIHTQVALAILAVVLTMFCLNALLVMLIVSGDDDEGDDDDT